MILSKKNDNELEEFKEFLRNTYSENDKTIKTLVSAVHTMIETGKSPDELPLSTRSKSIYRRALRKWEEFKAYKKANPRVIIDILRKNHAIRESRLRHRTKNVLKNEVEFNMSMVRAIESGKVFVNLTENDPIVIGGD